MHAIPHRDEDRPRISEFLARFGEPLATTAMSPCGYGTGSGSPTSCARSTRTAWTSPISSFARRLDDVFLAKTGRTLEGATEEAETEQEKDRR